MEVLTNSVGQTILNLREKRVFLARQREHYFKVREELLSAGETNSDVDEEDEKVIQNGSVHGDIIISSKKIYLNIGYEYFVEKTRDKAVEYVDEKLRLMEEAAEQFARKIEEGEKTLQNINEFSKQDEDIEEDYPPMEIREELDDNGNIVSSTVTPTPGPKMTKKVKSVEHTGKPLDDFEANLKGRLVSSSKTNGAEKKELATEQEVAESPQIDMDHIYTFADLVQQMDAQEELEDAAFDSENIEYDFDSFDKDGYQPATDEDEDEGEDGDSDEEENYSLLPGTAAQQAFMEQIRKLRALQDTKEVEPKIVMQETKSILKTQDDTNKSRPKKSVGFASTLDIYEVQNLKEENKKNVHDFPRGGFIQPLDDDEKEAQGITTEDFDSDLFAKLIGVQGPDEIHNKYKEKAAIESQESSKGAGNKKRVSRFKKERKSETANGDNLTGAEQKLALGKAVADNVVENESFSIHEQQGKKVRGNEAVSDFIFEKDDSSISNEPILSFSKDMKSLKRKQKAKAAPTNVISTFSHDEDEDDGNDIEMEKLQISETVHDNKNASESQLFPEEITERYNQKDKPIRIPNVDYTALGANMDDMARAYNLGIYDDDLDEDPGMVIEKIEDFKEYNKQVEILKDDIKENRTSNFAEMQNEIEEIESENDNALMTDVTEHEIPTNYSNADGQEDDHSDLGLEYSNLNESIAIEYSRLKEVINARNSFVAPDSGEDDTGKQFEPIDEFGNPIKTSRFRSQRLKMNK